MRGIAWKLGAAAALVFVGIATAVSAGRVDPLDGAVMQAMQRIDAPIWDRVMITATHIGDGVTRVIVIALVSLWALYRRWPRCAIVLIVNALVAARLNALLKGLFERPRPELFHKIELPDTFSFPSGHAMSAIAVFGSLVVVAIVTVPRLRRWLIAASAILIAAIGLSRTYVGVHWLSDVIGGFAAGTPLLAAVIWLLRDGPPNAQCKRDSGAAREPRVDSAGAGTPFAS